jgi:cell shape-determining protein MreC
MFKLLKILFQLNGKNPEKALDNISNQDIRNFIEKIKFDKFKEKVIENITDEDISNFFDKCKEEVIKIRRLEAENRELKEKIKRLEGG